MPPYPSVPIKSCRSSLKNVVYLIVSTRGKKYVGITTGTLKHRMEQHREAIRAGHGDGKKFIDYYRKNDFEEATVQVLYKPRGENIRQKLRQKEAEYIQEYDSMRNGLNSEL